MAGPDTGPRPRVDASANGTPVLNISTPNGAGVSHDVYSKFQANDVIVNNSAGGATTQVGGAVHGNPNLGGGAANLWVGEVVGGTQTTLTGLLEVAGPRLDVVLANEFGILCNGCGFINTGRTTLTTGTPRFGASGALDHVDVRQGTVTIGANGLNPVARVTSDQTGRVDVIARAAAIYGEMRARSLNLVTGANQVRYDWSYDPATDTVTGITEQSGTGAAPALAVDVAALGGMYANAIQMVATEDGVGVNLDTDLVSGTNIALSADGQLRLGNNGAGLKAARAITARATGPLLLEGALSAGAGDTITLSTTNGPLTVSGDVTAGAITLEGAGTTAIAGAITVHTTFNAQADTLTLTGATISAPAIHLTAIDTLALNTAYETTVTSETRTVDLPAAPDTTPPTVTLSGRVATTRARVTTLTAPGAITLTSLGDITTEGAEATAGTTLTAIAAQDLTFGTATDTVTITQGGTRLTEQTLKPTTLTTGGTLHATAGRDTVFLGTQIEAGHDLKLGATRNITVATGQTIKDYAKVTTSGGFLKKKTTTITRTSVTNVGAALTASRDLTFAAETGTFQTAGATLKSLNRNLTFGAQSIRAGTYTDTFRATHTVKKSILGGLFGSTSFSSTLSAIPRGLDAFAALTLDGISATDLALVGAQIGAGRTIKLTTARDLIIEDAVGAESRERFTSKTGAVFATTETERSHKEHVGAHTTFAAPDFDLTVDGRIVLNVSRESPVNGTPTPLSQTELRAQIKDLYPEEILTHAGLTLLERPLANTYFYDKTRALSPAFKALVAIAVSSFVPGLGTAFGFAEGGFAFAAANAFGNTFLLNSLDGVVSGNFDLGNILKDSAFSAVTAGLTAGINLKAPTGTAAAAKTAAEAGTTVANRSFNLLGGEWSKALNTSFLGFGTGNLSVANLLEKGLDNVITSGINSAVYGTDFTKSLSSSLVNTVANLALADVQFEIGELTKAAGFGEGSFPHAALHGIAGCAAAELTGADCAAGAAGAVASSLAAGYFERNPVAVDENLSAKEQEAQRLAKEQRITQLFSGLAGYVFSGGKGENVSAASQIGVSAIANNRQLHPDLAKLINRHSEAFAVEIGLCDGPNCTVEDLNAARAILTAAAYGRDDEKVSRSIIHTDHVNRGIAFLNELAEQRQVLAALGLEYENVRAATAAERKNPALNLEHSNDPLIGTLNGLLVNTSTTSGGYWNLLRGTTATPTSILTLSALASDPQLFDTLAPEDTVFLLREVGDNLQALGSVSSIGAAVGPYVAIADFIQDTHETDPDRAATYAAAYLGKGVAPEDVSILGSALIALKSEVFVNALLNDYLEGGRTEFFNGLRDRGVDTTHIVGGGTSRRFDFKDLQPVSSKYKGEQYGNSSQFPGSKVTYLNATERQAYKMQIKDGKIYDADGKLFDTSSSSSVFFGGQGKAIFVMDGKGNIYASKTQEVGKFHHSSFLAGQPVASAGELVVKNGVITGVTRRSGHYQPTVAQQNQFKERLQEGGIDTGAIDFTKGF